MDADLLKDIGWLFAGIATIVAFTLALHKIAVGPYRILGAPKSSSPDTPENKKAA